MAVIGAGVVGAAIAHRLAEKGIAALLLDRAEPGSGATAASFGGVTAREQTPRAFFDLCMAAMEEYRRLAWKLAPAPWYHADGSLAWLRDPAQRGRAGGAACNGSGSGATRRRCCRRARCCASLEPGLAIADPETPVAWFPDEAWVDPLAMTHRLVEGVRNAGGRVLTGPEREVVAIGVRDGRRASVTLRGGQTIPVSAVVNAAGVNADRVAAPGRPPARGDGADQPRPARGAAGRAGPAAAPAADQTASSCGRTVPAASCSCRRWSLATRRRGRSRSTIRG